jgi:hypothetical protein
MLYQVPGMRCEVCGLRPGQFNPYTLYLLPCTGRFSLEYQYFTKMLCVTRCLLGEARCKASSNRRFMESALAKAVSGGTIQPTTLRHRRAEPSPLGLYGQGRISAPFYAVDRGPFLGAFSTLEPFDSLSLIRMFP